MRARARPHLLVASNANNTLKRRYIGVVVESALELAQRWWRVLLGCLLCMLDGPFAEMSESRCIQIGSSP
jgi:hypothetical protein